MWRDLLFRGFHFLLIVAALSVCAALCGMMAGLLPASPNVEIWATGIILCVAASLAFGLVRPGRASAQGALLVGAIVFALPFIWLITTSFKQAEETFVTPVRWIPSSAIAPPVSPWIAGDGKSRAVSLGQMHVHLPDGSEPLVAAQWSTDGSAGLQNAGDSSVVHYDFTNRDTVELKATFQFAQPFDGVMLQFQQDESWHRVEFELQCNGESWVSEDWLYLGAKSSLEWTLSTAPIRPEERYLGIWQLSHKSSTADPGKTQLIVRIQKLSPFSATLAKWTQSYRDAWYADANWPHYIINSGLLVVLNIIGQLLACSMAAFALSRLKWPGREFTFGIILATMMLPGVVMLVPQFLIFKNLGWYNTLLPLWVPAFGGSPFFIFMLRQFMLGIPKDLEDAAKIDGCSWVGVYWRINLPLVRPALAAVAVFTFMGTWNEFMAPLIYLGDPRLFPLPLGLYNFRSEHGTQFNMLMAASALLTVPVVAVFFVAQRYFIESITVTGIK